MPDALPAERAVARAGGRRGQVATLCLTRLHCALSKLLGAFCFSEVTKAKISETHLPRVCAPRGWQSPRPIAWPASHQSSDELLALSSSPPPLLDPTSPGPRLITTSQVLPRLSRPDRAAEDGYGLRTLRQSHLPSMAQTRSRRRP